MDEQKEVIAMPTITMPIELPEEFIEETALAITNLVMVNIDKRIKLNELPPYPTKTQLKDVLKIGDDRINKWIQDGLPQIDFGRGTRFDREDIKQFINSMKTTY